MELQSKFKIIENQTSELPFEHLHEKRDSNNYILRANIVIAVISTMTLSQINNTKPINFQYSEEIQKLSLEGTEKVINNISNYSNDLNKNSVFDRSILFEKILSFKSLVYCWDGYNALPTGIKCAANAIEIVTKLDSHLLKKISDLFPNPNGTITFEWENNHDEIVSMEVGKETFTYFVAFNSFETKFFNKQKISFENIKTLKEYISAI